MKFTAKLFLVVCLFSSVAFADGNMGSGGYVDDGNMGSGGKTCTENCLVSEPATEPTFYYTDQIQSDTSILGFIQDYLISLF